MYEMCVRVGKDFHTLANATRIPCQNGSERSSISARTGHTARVFHDSTSMQPEYHANTFMKVV